MPTERPVGQTTGTAPLIGNERVLFNGGTTPIEATLSEMSEYIQSQLTESAPNDIVDWSPIQFTENANYQITAGAQYQQHTLSYTDLSQLPHTEYLGDYIGYTGRLTSLPAEVSIHIPSSGIVALMLHGDGESPLAILQSPTEGVNNPIVTIAKFGAETQLTLYSNGQTITVSPGDIGDILTLTIDDNSLLTFGGIPPVVFSAPIDTTQYPNLFIGSFTVITPTPVPLTFTVANTAISDIPEGTVDGAVFRITSAGDYNGQSLRAGDYTRYIESTDSFIIWRLPNDRTDLALTGFINNLIDSFLVKETTIDYIRTNAATEIQAACNRTGTVTTKILSEIAKLADINNGLVTHVDAFVLYMGNPTKPKILWRDTDGGVVSLYFTSSLPSPSQGVIYLAGQPSGITVESWGGIPLYVLGAPTSGGNIRLESGAMGVVYQALVSLTTGRTALHWEKIPGALLLRVESYEQPNYISNIES